MCKRHAKMCNKWALAVNNRNKGHPGTTTAKQKNSDPRMKRPLEVAKKHMLACEKMSNNQWSNCKNRVWDGNFCAWKKCWTKGTLWGVPPPCSCGHSSASCESWRERVRQEQEKYSRARKNLLLSVARPHPGAILLMPHYHGCKWPQLWCSTHGLERGPTDVLLSPAREEVGEGGRLDQILKCVRKDAAFTPVPLIHFILYVISEWSLNFERA